MLRVERRMNIDNFICSEESSKRAGESATHDQQTQTKFRSLYFKLNTLAVVIHLSNAVAIAILHVTHFTRIPKEYVFVSPVSHLQWTNHALVRVDASQSTCIDVETSPHFKATIPSSPALSMHLYPERKPYPNFMEHLFDFSNTAIIQYNIPGNELHLNIMIMCFSLLSSVFQGCHMWLLTKHNSMPRFLHYVEYALSSPLMVIVMAVNVGLRELFIITSLGALFFGMNILGMCAEAMAHYAGHIERDSLYTYSKICKSIHIAGWVLFLFAMCPIWMQFGQALKCSENRGTPDYAYAAIVVESILFFAFGILQAASMFEKFQYVIKQRTNRVISLYQFFIYDDKSENKTSDGTQNAMPIEPDVLFKYDCLHAILSLTAKTMLTWLLLGPALSVDPNTLIRQPQYETYNSIQPPEHTTSK